MSNDRRPRDPWHRRHLEGQVPRPGVDAEGEGRVVGGADADPAPAQPRHDRPCVGLRPVLGRHRPAVGAQPVEVVRAPGRGRRPAQEAAPAESGVLRAELAQPRDEVGQDGLPARGLPVDPARGVVVAVGVVVAALGPSQLVPAQDHRDPLAQEQRGQEVAALAGAQLPDGGVVGGALDAVVGRAVVVGAVPVVLAVGLVVLAVVRDQVEQGEAVVRGDEVERGGGPPTAVAVDVAGARQARREVGQRGLGAAPEIAHRVAVAPVPLAPARREVAHPVSARADVPGLRDQLDAREHGVLADGGQEERVGIEVARAPAEGGRQVEAEAVDVHLLHPVAERVHHQAQRLGAMDVEGVAAPGVVHVQARIVLEAIVSWRCRCRAGTASGRPRRPRRCG